MTDNGRGLTMDKVKCREDVALCVTVEGVYRFTLADLLKT